MLIAAIDDFGYRFFLLLHILSVIVAFAPGFVWPVVANRLRKDNQPIGSDLSKIQLGNTVRVHGPALLATGVFGFGMIGLSSKVIKFSQSGMLHILLLLMLIDMIWKPGF